MKELLEELFPIYRTLCGPGVKGTLDKIAVYLGMDDEGHYQLGINEYPSGSDVCGWTIPKEFIVKEAHVTNSNGEKIIDFKDHPYHLWIYSQPFDGFMNLYDLRTHLAYQDDCIPLRQCYYREDWGFSVTQEMYDALPEDIYSVHIDVEHRDGYLRIGEAYLEGETTEEILINSYICHPNGANDNLSGVVCAVELFKRLAQEENRRYSYRLCLWPETIGPITWIENNRTRPGSLTFMDASAVGDFPTPPKDAIANVIAALTLGICGDDSWLKLDQTPSGDTEIERALYHIRTEKRWGITKRKYSGFIGGTDSRHFNGMGLNIPAVTLTRGGPAEFPEYHTSLDTPDIINWDNMEETVDVAFNALQVMERNRVFKPTYITTPCLQKHDIFPYQHATGTGGKESTKEARAYFELMYLVDGKRDLLSIADSQGMSIFDFDEPVEKFLKAGLIEAV